jgi:hypothetical protein
MLKLQSLLSPFHSMMTVLTLHRHNLNKALTIAELRSPNRDDGHIARILWKTAMVLENNTFGKFAEEAERLKTRALVAQQQMLASGEGGEIPFIEGYEGDLSKEEDSYAALIPLFFR